MSENLKIMKYDEIEKPLRLSEILRQMPVGLSKAWPRSEKQAVKNMCSYLKKKEGAEFETMVSWVNNEIRVWRIK